MPYERESANDLHIVARGTTHLPFVQPPFGTPCAANTPATPRPALPRPKSMTPGSNGLMTLTAHTATHDDD
ncbi:MAG: hypothetical protein HXY39_00775 [Chloroflexi bacterium]|nr:hypothetical protein [Chloroflexota bacterium]